MNAGDFGRWGIECFSDVKNTNTGKPVRYFQMPMTWGFLEAADGVIIFTGLAEDEDSQDTRRIYLSGKNCVVNGWM